jgi:lysylphosphatidylglycerol synthetase-like protein (DUF2156 family)
MTESEEEKPTDYTGVIIGAALLPVLLFFSHMGKTDMGLNVGICLAIALITIRIYWNLRTRFWFWIIIVLLLVLHVPLVLMIQWPHSWVSRIALLPIGLADLLIYVGALKFVERFIVKSPSSDEGA